MIPTIIPNAILTLFVFAFGACIGSFLNAVAMRTVAEKKWWGSERSECDSCNTTLTRWDLIPVFSYLFLLGRCRYCGKKISPRHLYAELISGFGCVLLYFWWGISPALLMSVVALWFFLFNSLTDLESGYIYDAWAIALGVVGLLIRIGGGWHSVMDGLLGAALGFGVILLIIIVSRGGMGWGDATLMLGAAGALGWTFCAIGMYLGFMVGVAIILPLLLTKKVSRKDAVPLGPFLAAGCMLAILFGGSLLAHFGIDPSWPWLRGA